jgi:hypothetical protein
MKVGEEGEIAAAFASLVQLGAGGPSSTPIRSFRADEGKSWRRHRATLSQRPMGTPNLSRPAA